MKRSIKNIGMIIFIIVLSIGMFFTTKYLKPTIQNTNQIGTPPTMPSGNSSSNNTQNTPPEKPSDDNSSNNTQNTPPEKPSDDNSSNNTQNTPSEKPSDDNSSNNAQQITSENNTQNEKSSILFYVLIICEGTLLAATISYLILSKFNLKTRKETFENGDKVVIYVLIMSLLTACISSIPMLLSNKESSNNSQNNQMNQNSTTTYSAKEEITEDKTITSGSYSSTTKDENAILANGNIKVNISNVKVNKTGDSNGGDNTSFYGTNSAILAKSGSVLTLKNITVNTNATGANGVFSYGGSATTSNSSSDGTTVNISDSTITTTKDNSGGIMTTGGGVMNANNLTINTSGISSAAIRSDRGGGDVTVNKGTYTTTGQGSPAIYSTANIKVSNAKLISKASEGVVIEGKNSVTLDNVELTDTNNKLNGQSTTYKNIFLYQSMSGDADNGTAEFTSKNSTITTNKGDTLYVTNTTASITLENNTIVNNDTTGNFLRIQKDSWGNSGSNGGVVTLNLTNQNAKGNIVVDSISTLTMNMSNNSYYEGKINTDNTAKSITLKLDKTSKIKLTGDTYITSLENSDSSNSNIDFNGYKLYVNGKAIN